MKITENKYVATSSPERYKILVSKAELIVMRDMANSILWNVSGADIPSEVLSMSIALEEQTDDALGDPATDDEPASPDEEAL